MAGWAKVYRIYHHALSTLLSPITIFLLLMEGRTWNEAKRALQIGKPIDRIDTLPLAGMTAASKLPNRLIYYIQPFKPRQRASHNSRYLFAKKMSNEGGLNLDLGCGYGYGSALLQGKTIGIEIEKPPVRYARRHYSTAQYHRADGVNLPIKDGTIHLVTCFEVLEHVEDDVKLLEELKRVTTRNSKILISVPNNQVLDETVEAMKDRPHVHSYTPGSLRNKITDRFDDATIDIYHHGTPSLTSRVVLGSGRTNSSLGVNRNIPDEGGALLCVIHR